MFKYSEGVYVRVPLGNLMHAALTCKKSAGDPGVAQVCIGILARDLSDCGSPPWSIYYCLVGNQIADYVSIDRLWVHRSHVCRMTIIACLEPDGILWSPPHSIQGGQV